MCAADHQLFETQCTRVSLPSVTTFLSALHVSRRHAQLPEEAEFCSPCFVFASCVSQPKLLFFSFLFFFCLFFSKGKLFNSCVEQDQRNSKWKNSHSFFIFFFFFPLLKRLGAFEKPDSAVTICEMSVCVGVRECARACICGLSLSYPCSPERGAAASLHGRKREVGREGGRERND